MSIDPNNLLAEVKQHCLDNYNKHGYDFVVETMDDSEVLEVIGRARSLNGALKAIRRHVRPSHNRRQEQLADSKNCY